MEKIKSKYVSVSVHDRTLYLEYSLYKYSMDEFFRYSVSVTDRSSGEISVVQDITTDYFVAAQCFQRVVNGKVTPVTLLDVISDFVAE